MKKGLVFLLILWIVLTSNIVFSAEVETEVLNKINENGAASVIVMLKDEQVESRKSLSSFDFGGERENFERRKNMIKNQQENVLSNLKIKRKDFSGVKKDLVSASSEDQADFELEHKYSTVNGFSGTVTRQGIEKLMQDPNVGRVYINGKVHAFLDSTIPQINANDVWSSGYTGDGNSADSTQAVALVPNEEIFVLAEHNYSSAGNYDVNVTAVNGTLAVSQNISVSVE